MENDHGQVHAPVHHEGGARVGGAEDVRRAGADDEPGALWGEDGARRDNAALRGMPGVASGGGVEGGRGGGAGTEGGSVTMPPRFPNPLAPWLDGSQPAAVEPPPKPSAPPRCTKPGHTLLACSECAVEQVSAAVARIIDLDAEVAGLRGDVREAERACEQVRQRSDLQYVELLDRTVSLEDLRGALGMDSSHDRDEVLAELRDAVASAVAHSRCRTRPAAQPPLPPPDPSETRLLLELLDREQAQLERQAAGDATWAAWRQHRVRLVQRCRVGLQALIEPAAQPAEARP